jgi:tight adherence protein C
MTSAVFLAAGMAFTGAGIFIGTYATASRPSMVSSRLGRRGRRRMEALAKSSSWARLEPFVRWLGKQLGPFIPQSVAARLELLILHAGDYLGLLPQEFVAITLLSGLGGAAFGFAIDAAAATHGLLVMAFITFGFLAPYFDISGAGDKRLMEINRGLPYAVDLFALGMSAGLDFPGSVRQFVSKALPDDPLADEMEYVLQMLQLGYTRRAALADFAERVPSDAVREFVHTVVHAEEKGNPLAEALLIQAQVSRMRRTVRAEEQAAKAGVKLIFPLTLIFGAMILLLLGPIYLKVMDQIRPDQHVQDETVVAGSPEKMS